MLNENETLSNEIFNFRITKDPLYNHTFELIPELKLEKQILKNFVFYQLINKISSQITKEIPKLELLRCNSELTRLVQRLVIEFLPVKLDKVLDKRTIAIEIIKKIYSDNQLTDVEIDIILEQIDFQMEHDLIKKISRTTKVYRYLIKNIEASLRIPSYYEFWFVLER